MPLLFGCELTGTAAGDLKDVELAAALAVDKTDEGMAVEVQLLHRDRALEHQYAESYYQLNAVGDNLAEAVSNLYDKGARRLNFSHAAELVIGEAAAAPENWLDYAVLSAQLRPTLYPVIAEGSAADLLNSDGAVLSRVYLLNNILEPFGSGYAGAFAVTLQDFMTFLSQPGIAPSLPYIGRDRDGVRLVGMAVYDGAAWQILSEGETTLAWRLLLKPGHIRDEVITLDDGISLNITKARVRRVAGDMDLTIDIRLKAEVLANPQNISPQVAEARLAEYIDGALQAAIAESRSLGVDFLGLGRDFWRQQPLVWQNIAGSDYLSRIKVAVNTSADIEREQI